MSTQFPDLFAALAAPFEPHEVKTREQAGRKFHYITARVAMNRLDNVLGPEGWWDRYPAAGENSVLCRLTIRLPDGSTLTKCDAGGYAGMADSGDDDKSGYSDAFKRAVVKFGVGRYLYRDGVPAFAQEAHGEVPNARPPLSNEPARQEQRAESRPPQNGSHGGGGGHGVPRSGRALFAWVKETEQKHEVKMLSYLNEWAKRQDFGDRMVDWTPEQVTLAHAEGMRKLATVGKTEGELPSVRGRDDIAPGQFPDNRTGHGRGQYDSPGNVAAYQEFLRRFVEERNQRWLDSWSDEFGQLADGVKELLRTHQLTNHLLKFGLREKLLADVGVTHDPETGKPEPAVSTPNAEKYVSILMSRHRDTFFAECDRYVQVEAEKAEAEWNAKHGKATETPARG